MEGFLSMLDHDENYDLGEIYSQIIEFKNSSIRILQIITSKEYLNKQIKYLSKNIV